MTAAVVAVVLPWVWERSLAGAEFDQFGSSESVAMPEYWPPVCSALLGVGSVAVVLLIGSTAQKFA